MLALQVESWQRMVATVVCVEGDITISWGLNCMFALFGKGACTFAHISERQHQLRNLTSNPVVRNSKASNNP